MRSTLPDAAPVRGRMVLRPLRPATWPRRKTRDQRFGRTQALVNTPIVAMASEDAFALCRKLGPPQRSMPGAREKFGSRDVDGFERVNVGFTREMARQSRVTDFSRSIPLRSHTIYLRWETARSSQMASPNSSGRDLSAGQYVYVLCLNRGALIKASTMPSFAQNRFSVLGSTLIAWTLSW